jgi:tetratricopeptide repeat protein
MFEKIIFNLFAFTLFILMFIKFIRKNDTSYVYLLALQFAGIAINFVELSFGKSFGLVGKLIMYILSVFAPIFFFWLEYKKNIDFAEIYYLLASKIAILVGKEEVAKKYLKVLTEKYPNSITGHKNLAKLYEKEEKYELALEEYERVYELDPENQDIYLKIGKLYGNVGRANEAIGILSELLKKKPDYYEASMALADILNSRNEFKEAVQVYMLALKYRPADYDLYYNLGMTYTLLNDFSKAKECYEKAAQINSDLYHARYSLGQLNLLYGDLEEAEKYFMECIDAEEVEAGAYYYLARIAMIKGETDKAKNYANIAIEENPTLYDKMADENIFMPIINEVNKPRLNVENRKKNKKKSLSKKEILIDLHLDNTCKLVGKLNNNDIEMMANVKKSKEKEINIDEERQID